MDLALCEYDCKDMAILAEAARLRFVGREEPLRVSCFFRLEDMLCGKDIDKYDVIVLGVSDNNDFTPIQKEKLRKISRKSRLILTGCELQSGLSAELGAAYALLKPINEAEFKLILKEALSERGAALSFRCGYSQLSFPYNEIAFIESCNNVCRIHTVFGTSYKVSRTLSSFSQALSEPFLQCHRSFIVNMDNIISADTDFVMCTGERVLIRQREVQHIKSIVRRHLSEKSSLPVGIR